MSERILWVDFAKGIAIILMVMGHTSIPDTFSKYIWSFHMPLFFIVSGLLFNSKCDSFKFFIKRKIRALIIPYIFFSILVQLGYWGTAFSNISELFLGWKGYALWFMPVFFMSNILLFYFIRNRIFLFLSVPLSILLSYLCYIFDICFPFKMEVVPFAYFFCAIGYLLKPFMLRMKSSYIVLIFVGTLTIILSQVLPKLDMCVNYMGIIPFNLFNAIIGSYFIFIFCIKFEYILSKIPFLKWAGQNSLFIMAFSQLFNYWILVVLSSFKLNHFFSLTLRYLLLAITIFLVSEILKKYFPKFIGK